MVRLLKKFTVVKAGRCRDQGRPCTESLAALIGGKTSARGCKTRQGGKRLAGACFSEGVRSLILICFVDPGTGRGRDSPDGLTLPYSDHRGPERRILLLVSDCLLNARKDAFHSRLRRDAQLNRFGQKAAAQGLIMCDKRFK